MRPPPGTTLGGQGMATKKKTEETDVMETVETAAPAGPDDLVEVMLFKDSGKYKDDVFVAVNGVGCLIKRGEPVKIKRKFAEVLQNSMKQDQSTAELIEYEANRFREAEKQLI